MSTTPRPARHWTSSFSDHFSGNEPGIFTPLHETLLLHGDHYMHLADLMSYMNATTGCATSNADSDAWVRKAILNVASSGKFSSDRTIAEYEATSADKTMPGAVGSLKEQKE